jgi:xanthine/CO dehydrogenase XdhC/CoxF family maturation factor
MRQEIAGLIDLADRMLASNLGGTLATLFSARGSTYRTVGSLMVGFPGVHAGGISGGCLDDFVIRQGGVATRDEPASLLSFNTDRSGDGVPALGCGGAIEILVERLTPAHLTLLNEIADAYDRDEPSLLACTVDRSRGSIAVTREWLHHVDDISRATPELARIVREVARDRTSCHVASGSARATLVHYIPALTRLVIFGAGDDAQPLCDLGRSLGWHVTVVDRRARLATEARFPTADAVLAADWDEAVNALRFTPRTAAVLMTHSIDDDARILPLLARRPLSYVGALGPGHRRRWLLEAAEREGPLSDALAQALRGPIGLDLGDRSAAGIAIAVAAEILAQLNERHRITMPECDAPLPA